MKAIVALWLGMLATLGALAAPPQTLSIQGYLTGPGAAPVNGNVTIVFGLYTAASGGPALWTETLSVPVASGMYNVTIGNSSPLGLPFDTPYYLGITVGTDAEMTPRQPLASVGYAFRAKQVDQVSAAALVDGSITKDKLAPSGCAIGQVLQYDGSAWACVTGPTSSLQQGGNAFGTVASLGTVDFFPVQIKANNVAGLRIEPNSRGSTIVGGHSSNVANVSAAVIAGGGVAAASPGGYDPATFDVCNGGNCNNQVLDHGGTIGGGVSNRAGDGAGTTGDRAYATVSGGMRNTASGVSSTVSGGIGNTASGDSSTVGGGYSNFAYGNYSFVAGRQARSDTAGALSFPLHGTFVWADDNPYPFHAGATNEFSARATGGVRFVTAIDGSGNPTATLSIDNTATLTAPGLRVSTNGTKITRLQSGEANLGTNPGGGVSNYTITFPAAFTGTPRVVVTPKSDLFGGVEVNDTFTASLRAISSTQFKVNVVRADIAGGAYNVNVRLEWMAWE